MFAEIKSYYRAHQKKINEDRPKLSAAKYRPKILVSTDIKIQI